MARAPTKLTMDDVFGNAAEVTLDEPRVTPEKLTLDDIFAPAMAEKEASDRRASYMSQVPEPEPPPLPTFNPFNPMGTVKGLAERAAYENRDSEQATGIGGDLAAAGGSALGTLSRAIYGAAEWAAELLPEGLSETYTKEAKARTDLAEDFLSDRMARMTPEMQAAMEKRWAETGEGAAWKDWRAWVGQGINTSATMLPTVMAGVVSGGTATMAMLTALAVEGVIAGGDASVSIRQEIEALPHEQLMKDAPRYAELVEQLGDQTKARDQFVEESRQLMVPVVAATSAVLGRMGGKVGDKVAEKVGGTGRLASAGRGAIKEGIQEAPQSAGEQFTQNIAAQAYDPDRPLMQDVGEATVAGGALGSALGGTVSGVVGDRRPAPNVGTLPPEQTEAPPGAVPPTDDPASSADEAAVLAEMTAAAQPYEEESAKKKAEKKATKGKAAPAAPAEPASTATEAVVEPEVAPAASVEPEAPAPVAAPPVNTSTRRKGRKKQGELDLVGGEGSRSPSLDVGPPAPEDAAATGSQLELELEAPPQTPVERAKALIAEEEAETQKARQSLNEGLERIAGAVRDERETLDTKNRRPTGRALQRLAGTILTRMQGVRGAKKKQVLTRVDNSLRTMLDGIAADDDQQMLSGLHGLIDQMPHALRGGEAVRALRDTLSEAESMYEAVVTIEEIIDDTLGRQVSYVGARSDRAVERNPKVAAAKKKVRELGRKRDYAEGAAAEIAAAMAYAEAREEYAAARTYAKSSRGEDKKTPQKMSERLDDARLTYADVFNASKNDPDSSLMGFLQLAPVRERFGPKSFRTPTHVQVEQFNERLREYAGRFGTDADKAADAEFTLTRKPAQGTGAPRKASRKLAEDTAKKDVPAPKPTPTRQEATAANAELDAARKAEEDKKTAANARRRAQQKANREQAEMEALAANIEKLKSSEKIRGFADAYAVARTEGELSAIRANQVFKDTYKALGVSQKLAEDYLAEARRAAGTDVEYVENLGFTQSLLDEAVDFSSIAGEMAGTYSVELHKGKKGQAGDDFWRPEAADRTLAEEKVSKKRGNKKLTEDENADLEAAKQRYNELAASDAEVAKWLAEHGGELELPQGGPQALDHVARISRLLSAGYSQAEGSTTAYGILTRMALALPETSTERAAVMQLISSMNEKFAKSVKVVFAAGSPETPLGRYNPETNTATIYTGQPIDASQFVRTVIHELTHASVDAALRQPRFNQAITALRNSLPGQYNTYGQTSNHEFLAEAMSNPVFQALLRSTKLSVSDQLKVRAALEGKATPRMTLSNWWQAFTTAIKAFVFRQVDVQDSVLAWALKAQKAGGVLQGAEPLRQPLEQDLLLSRVLERASRSPAADTGIRAMLGTMSGDQLVDSYGTGFPEVKIWEELTRNRASTAHNEHERSGEIFDRWTAMAFKDKETAIRFNDVALDSTRFGYDPSRPMNHFNNEHLIRSQKTAARAAPSVARIRRKYQSLPKEWQQLYQEVRDEYENRFQRTRAELARNYIEVADLGLTPAQQAKLITDLIAPKNSRGAFDYTPYGLTAPTLQVGKNGKPSASQQTKYDSELEAFNSGLAALEFLRRTIHTRGPYFPLNRDGRWIVEADLKEVRKFKSRAAREAARDRILGEDPSAHLKNIKGGFDLQVEQKAVSFFESRNDAHDFINEINTSPQWAGWTTGAAPKLKAEMSLPQGGVVYQIAGELTKKFSAGPNADPAAVQRIHSALLEFMPEAGSLRNAVRRRNVTGANSDMIRAFAKNSMSSAWAYSQLHYGRRIAQVKQDFNDKLKADSASGYDSVSGSFVWESINNRDLADAASFGSLSHLESTLIKTGFVWYLFSASYPLINSLQTAMVTMPWLAMKHGFGRANRELMRAGWAIGRPAVGQLLQSGWGARAAVVGSKFTAESLFGRVKEHVLAGSATDKQQVHDLLVWMDRNRQFDSSLIMSLSEGAQVPSTSKTGTVLSHMERAIRYAAQAAEIFNRATSGIAAYRLAIQDGKSEQEAREHALVGTRRTHFDYSLTNRPPILSGKIGRFTNIPMMRAIMLFKTHPVGVMSLVLSMARDFLKGGGNTAPTRAAAAKGLAAFFGMHILMAGAIGGTPEMLRAMWGLLEMFLGAFEEDDEEIKQTLNIEIRQAAHRIGTWAMPNDPEQAQAVGMLLSRGLPAYMGIDISSRVGLDQMILPRTYNTEMSRDTLYEASFALLGPIGGMVANGFRMVELSNKGQVMKGVEGFAPKFIKDAMKAERFNTKGMTDFRGKVLIPADEFDTVDYVTRLAGFAPTKETNVYDNREATTGLETRIKARRSQLLEQYHNAEGEDKKALLERMQAFNAQYPDWRIQRSTLLRSQRERRRIERQTRDGVYLDPKYRRALAGEGGF